jgi:mannose-6-phosphate isomerase
MAASDNVVRAGFTPKFKDIDTLTSMLTYNTAPASEQKMSPEKFRNCHYSTLYDPPIEEFSVVRTELRPGQQEDMGVIQGPSLLIVTSGNGLLSSSKEQQEGGRFEIPKGSVWFIGAGEGILLTSQDGMVTHRAFVEV